jgi:hypothetical protein
MTSVSPEASAAQERAAAAIVMNFLKKVVIVALGLGALFLGMARVMALEIDVQSNRATAAFIVNQVADDRVYRQCVEKRRVLYTKAEETWFIDLRNIEHDTGQHDSAWYHIHRQAAFDRRLPEVQQSLNTTCEDAVAKSPSGRSKKP